MAIKTRIVEYYYATVPAAPGGGYEVMSALADHGVDLAAVNAVPIGPESVQLTLFPTNTDQLIEAAAKTGVSLAGPNHALLVRGEDRPGALASVLRRLHDAQVHVFASNGMACDQGSFMYLLYVRPEHLDRASRALDI